MLFFLSEINDLVLTLKEKHSTNLPVQLPPYREKITWTLRSNTFLYQSLQTNSSETEWFKSNNYVIK